MQFQVSTLSLCILSKYSQTVIVNLLCGLLNEIENNIKL